MPGLLVLVIAVTVLQLALVGFAAWLFIADPLDRFK